MPLAALVYGAPSSTPCFQRNELQGWLALCDTARPQLTLQPGQVDPVSVPAEKLQCERTARDALPALNCSYQRLRAAYRGDVKRGGGGNCRHLLSMCVCTR